jgi:energy-coupling factor transporter transmembrane protein EcfT
MLKIILIFLLGIVACYFIAKAILKFVPKKVQPLISIALLIIAILLAYLSYQGVMTPIKFNEEKTKRYSKVIDNLKMIRKGQTAHKRVNGKYAPNGADLVKFIDTAKFAVTEARNETRTINVGGGLSVQKEFRVVDTTGYTDVRASFVGKNYKTMMKVPDTDTEFTMKLGEVQKMHGYMAPVYEVSVDKKVVLSGMDAGLIKQELEAYANDQVKGSVVKVGSLDEVSDSGNWPTDYDQAEIQALIKK